MAVTKYVAYVDNRPDLILKAERLGWSLVTLGRISVSDIRFHVAPTVRVENLAVTSHLGIQCIQSVPWDHLPYCNKVLTLLDEPERSSDSVMILDCDTLAARPIRELRSEIAARPADRAIAPSSLFRELAARAGLSIAFAGSGFRQQKVPTNLFDGGLYFFSRSMVERMKSEWPKWIAWLEEEESAQGLRPHFDEIALLFAIEENNLRPRRLSEAYNFPVQRKRPFWSDRDPYIIHYHNHIARSGRLRRIPVEPGIGRFSLPMASKRIGLLNRELVKFDELRATLVT